jgi:hypothetical protein
LNMWSLTLESHLWDHSHRSQSMWQSREAEEGTQSDSWEISMLICFRIIHLTQHWGQTWQGLKSWMTKPRENGWHDTRLNIMNCWYYEIKPDHDYWWNQTRASTGSKIFEDRVEYWREYDLLLCTSDMERQINQPNTQLCMLY